MKAPLRIFIGFDPREDEAFAVCRASLQRRASVPLDVRPLVLEHLRWAGHYRRPHSVREGLLWDDLSNAPMSTEFALTRFCVPALAGWGGWALYVDCDFLFRADVAELFALADPRFAVQVVKHQHTPAESLKMDGQIQTAYPRKNWSSLVLWNCGHPAHRPLRPLGDAGEGWGILDRWPGLRLHQFGWLQSTHIGALPEAWNWLEGSSAPDIHALAVHYTRGGPWLEKYRHAPYADEWRSYLDRLPATEPLHACG